MDRWNGKVALVTGASAGIGAAIVKDLVRHGLKVVAIARRVDKIEELKKELSGAKGELFPLKGDVSKPEEVDQVFKFIQDKFNTIHVLVNNAGIARTVSITDGKFEFFEDVVKVNILGLVKCSQKALQLMKSSNVDDGHIIHINSVAGHIIPALPDMNVYPATKHAVTALTETMRQEVRTRGTKIRITSISPGYVKTEIMGASRAATGAEINEAVAAMIETMPALEAQDISDGVIYALSAPARVQIHEIIIKPTGELF